MSDQSFTDTLDAALVAFGVATTQTGIEWKRRYEAIETVRNFLEGLRGHGCPSNNPAVSQAAAARIEQLEAALRDIVISCEDADKNFNWLPTIASIARAALAPEQDK
jgi:hypothetical protein